MKGSFLCFKGSKFVPLIVKILKINSDLFFLKYLFVLLIGGGSGSSGMASIGLKIDCIDGSSPHVVLSSLNNSVEMFVTDVVFTITKKLSNVVKNCLSNIKECVTNDAADDVVSADNFSANVEHAA